MNELTNFNENKVLDRLRSNTPGTYVRKKKDKFLLTADIQDWQNCDAIETIAAGLRKGDELTLKREEGGDGCEVAVLDKYGQRIGYLKGGNHKVIARLMDAGKQFRAVLIPKNGAEDLSATVWGTPGEKTDVDDYRAFNQMSNFLSMNIYWVE